MPLNIKRNLVKRTTLEWGKKCYIFALTGAKRGHYGTFDN